QHPKENMACDIDFLHKSNTPSELNLPLYIYPIAAGFPSPAEDYIDHPLDLHEYFIKHPASTFYARAIGDSMNKAGIFENSIMAIDKSLEARDGDIVVAAVNNEFTVKRFVARSGKIKLCPESSNPNHKPIHFIKGSTDVTIWGVVVGIFSKTR
ncbi:MAG: translesion error-prone DNA polymerase V autoproteolytic subunit, partial [Pseudomonadota bacterium]